MFLHLGQYTVIKTDEIIGVFDLDNTTVSKHTRNFLKTSEKNGEVKNVSFELPKSFVVSSKAGLDSVYISQLSPSTLVKRFYSENY